MIGDQRQEQMTALCGPAV
jgi:hypothetical protein